MNAADINKINNLNFTNFSFHPRHIYFSKRTANKPNKFISTYTYTSFPFVDPIEADSLIHLAAKIVIAYAKSGRNRAVNAECQLRSLSLSLSPNARFRRARRQQRVTALWKAPPGPLPSTHFRGCW